MRIDFKCPYNEFSCVHVNTCGMSVDKACSECEHYHNGVRATSAMPGLEAVYHGVKKLIKQVKDGLKR